MPRASKPLIFSTRVERLETGMRYHVVPVPDEVADHFIEAGHKRVLATLNGHETRRAIQGPKDGGRYLVLGKAELKAAGVKLGDAVTVSLVADPEPDVIDLSPEFIEALKQDDEARERWESFPLGRQRSLAHYLTSPKRADTRLKRALEIAEKLRTYTLYGDRDSTGRQNVE